MSQKFRFIALLAVGVCLPLSFSQAQDKDKDGLWMPKATRGGSMPFFMKSIRAVLPTVTATASAISRGSSPSWII